MGKPLAHHLDQDLDSKDGGNDDDEDDNDDEIRFQQCRSGHQHV